MKILVVEDHPDLGELVCLELNKAGFVTDLARSAAAAAACQRLHDYDALILDLGLPDTDGMDVLKERSMQAKDDIPCLILTARDDLASRVNALNFGADDYILKPFDMPELEARLRAVLRRSGPKADPRLRFGDLSFSPQNRLLEAGTEDTILARREAVLIETLIKAAPRVVIKDHLEETLYGMDENASSNAVEALISRTRRKLKSLQSHCKIETMHGVGYRLSN
ncbi:MAG: response regulator transcription factor [Cellvibrionaceae bacterium]|nr:response regulator transcription factor [Cellvibrionaceae bacterium]